MKPLELYKEAAGFSWDPGEPLKEGDFAEAFKGPLVDLLGTRVNLDNESYGESSNSISDNIIVVIQEIVGDYARVRLLRRSEPLKKYIHLSDLRKVLAVSPSDKPKSDRDYYILIPDDYGNLSKIFPELWDYLGERLTELYDHWFTRNVNGKDVPIVDAPIVIASFLEPEQRDRALGFVCPFGPFKGTIFINAKVRNRDMVAAHEYTHIIGARASEVEKIVSPYIEENVAVGDMDYETDPEIFMLMRQMSAEEINESRPTHRDEMADMEADSYIRQQTEFKAHGEQMLWELYKLKKQQIKNVLAKLNSKSITQDQANKSIENIKNADPTMYEDKVMNSMESGRPTGKYMGQEDKKSKLYRLIYKDYVVDRSWEVNKKINQQLKKEMQQSNTQG